MNEDLSRIVAGIVAQAKAGEDLSSGISRIRSVIQKVIENEDTIFGKFHALVESFREVIPEEKLRYQAATKALSTTSKLSRQDIVAAVNNQLEELKILEKLMLSALPGLPDELKAMEAKSQKTRDEISILREKIAQLEKEEKEIAAGMAERERETAVIEKALQDVFADFGAEITSVKKKVEELPAENAAQQPIPLPGIKTDLAAKTESSSGEKSIGDQISSPNSAKPLKTCPMCGGQMSLSTTRKMWQCFACAYEEPDKDEIQSKTRELSAAIFPEPVPVSDPGKKCRICGGRMDYYIAEKNWQCFSCGNEESGRDEVQGNGEPGKDSIFPEPPMTAGLKQNGKKDEQRTPPEPVAASALKQKCPMCGGQMDYYAAEEKWQCYSCGFESFNKEEGQSKSEEKQDHSNALLVFPAAESLLDLSSTTRPSPGLWGEPKKGSSSSKRPSVITKTCPGCGKKMQSHGSDRGWQCRNCGYERRI